jgi:hypothetical protein
VLRGGQHGQHGAAVAVGVQAPSPAEDAFAVLPQDLEAVLSASAEPKGCIQSPHSTGKVVVAIGLQATKPARIGHHQLEPEVC